MHVLVIGGNRFMGARLVWALLFARRNVTLLNRGLHGDPFGDRVERLVADRGTDQLDRVLAGRRFDAVVDFAGFTGPELERSVRVLEGKTDRFVFISTGQVYLVREGCPRPAKESDFDGPVMAKPPTIDDLEDWQYGVDKRAAEEALRRASFPTITLRVPMVNGEHDPKRRFEAYLARALDGGPLLVPRGGELARHVSAHAVVSGILRVLERPATGHAIFNLAQREVLPVRELVERLCRHAGAAPRLLDVSAEQLEARGLVVRDVSPFSSRWMSFVDPSKAERELGFVHPPLDEVIGSVVASLLADWPKIARPGLEKRSVELELAASLG